MNKDPLFHVVVRKMSPRELFRSITDSQYRGHELTFNPKEVHESLKADLKRKTKRVKSILP